MIDVCSVLNQLSTRLRNHYKNLPLLAWKTEWKTSLGNGIVAGLLDTDFDENIPDLKGANLVVRNFSGCNNRMPWLIEHGTYSVATLIGQGHYQIRGIAPDARLMVAKVIEADGKARHQSVIEALKWMVSAGARIIILPLGETKEHPAISSQLEKGSADGIIFFAAAGNNYPDPLFFTARHPLAIAVGATDAYGNLLSTCSRHPRLDLVAPGYKIAAPVRGRLVRRRGGSSVACVLAAGAAVLALSSGTMQIQSLNRISLLNSLLRT